MHLKTLKAREYRKAASSWAQEEWQIQGQLGFGLKKKILSSLCTQARALVHWGKGGGFHRGFWVLGGRRLFLLTPQSPLPPLGEDQLLGGGCLWPPGKASPSKAPGLCQSRAGAPQAIKPDVTNGIVFFPRSFPNSHGAAAGSPRNPPERQPQQEVARGETEDFVKCNQAMRVCLGEARTLGSQGHWSSVWHLYP